MNSTIQNIYFRSDQAKAYTLLSPALILVIFAMAAPMIVMIFTSFNTQISMIEIDRTFTTGRYEDFFSKPIFVQFQNFRYYLLNMANLLFVFHMQKALIHFQIFSIVV